MNYTENQIKEAIDLAKHQNPQIDWNTVTDRLFIALGLIANKRVIVWRPKKHVSQYDGGEIRQVFHNMRTRRVD